MMTTKIKETLRMMMILIFRQCLSKRSMQVLIVCECVCELYHAKYFEIG